MESELLMIQRKIKRSTAPSTPPHTLISSLQDILSHLPSRARSLRGDTVRARAGYMWLTKKSSAKSSRRSPAQQATLLSALNSQWAPHSLGPKGRRIPCLAPPFTPCILFVSICSPFSCSFPILPYERFPNFGSDGYSCSRLDYTS
jgi:hypothetical protein